MEFSLNDLAKLVDGTVVGNGDVLISRVVGIEDLHPGDLTLGGNKEALDAALSSEAAAVIVANGTEAAGKPLLQVSNPRLAFAQLLERFNVRKTCVPGIHNTAVIGRDFSGDECEIGALVFVGDRVKIGRGTIIEAGSWIGDEVEIGENCYIHGNVTIYHGCRLKNKVEIHSGTVIGADGFGYVTTDGHHFKVPQTGIVVLEDNVEIGANTTIDRATTTVTAIGEGTKIDNLVQIGHNCSLGQNDLICSMVGVAGSTVIGDRVTMAGKAGIVGHIKINDDCLVGGYTKVVSDLPQGSYVSGVPAQLHTRDMRVEAAKQRMPELLKEFRQMKKTIESLQAEIEKLK